MKTRLLRILSVVILLAMIMTTPAIAASIGGKNISAAGACLLDYNTGEVIYSHNGNVSRVPASMTKIMTAYCIYDAIEKGEISLKTIVPISTRAYNMARNPEYQCVPLNYNANYTVDELLGVLITYSPIAPAVALAELVSGSEAQFVKRMNAKAQELGIDAYFCDSSGLGNNKITPIGMAKLARCIIKDHPDIINRTSKRYVTFRGTKYYSTNKLYTSLKYPGADGLKTGTTSASGYCFCGTAIRDGQRYIAVSMGASSATQRFVDVANMLDYGFSLSNKKKNVLLHTDKRTFINGNEIPTFTHKASGRTVVLAEDLANYGFNVSYDSGSRTLTVIRNRNKAPTPISMNYYRNKNGNVAYNLTENKVKLIIKDGERTFSPTTVYNTNGYIGFSVEDLSAIFTTDKESGVLNIYTDNTTLDIPTAAANSLSDNFMQKLSERFPSQDAA